tara:strand:+ start:135 stop:365 length:231 start_codon:yes stop_codon:yes gene_type:complete
MRKIFNFLFISLMLVGCAASVSAIKNKTTIPETQIIEQNHNEMLELAREMDQERTPAIYVVVISEPEIVIAKPPEK